MKKLLILLLAFVSLTACNAQTPEDVLAKDHSIDTNKVLVPDELYKRENQIITQLLQNYHYKKMPLNDSLSSAVFDEYIGSLDNNKLYFLKSDMQSFEKYRHSMDENLLAGNLNPAFDIFNVYKRRLNERIKYVNKRLSEKFDFTKKESFIPDREKADWAASKEELDELWRQRLKYDVLNLILSGKDEKAAVDVLLKRYHNFHKIILQYEPEDVFQYYMNSFAEVYDPHSNYFSPATSFNFNMSMKLSLEGIGATLRQDNDYTVVVSIVPGGPAAKSGLLHEEDKIVGVAQGDEGEFVDVIGWRLDDAIQLIRGKKGTVVRLQILHPKDSPSDKPTEIRLVRDEVKLEEQAAKSKVINIDESGTNFKIGVIDLPSFYVDFEGQKAGKKDYRSTTRDVKNILSDFKKEKVDGVIIDLRNNGGGSLQEAVQLTGLFIKDGPVVQVKSSNGAIEEDDDQDSSIFYTGPLAVMVNRFSASASEIFSGAIQDYGRGLIIGSNTYGKGTVQNLVGLDRFIPAAGKNLGELKLTIAKFYRVTGSSTQLKGVKPDIEFPSLYSAKEFGEASKSSALQWDQIKPAEYSKYSDLGKIIPLLSKKHTERAKTDPEYQFLLEDIRQFNESRDKKEYSLNEEVRRKEMQEAEALKKKREEEKQKLSKLEVIEKKEVDPQKSSVDDYELKESGRILADMIMAKVG